MNVEAIWIGKLGAVPIGRRKDRQHEIALLQFMTQKSVSRLTDPREPVKHRAKPQDFLDGGWQNFRWRQHFSPSFGMLIEAPQRVADQRRRRLVARHQQQKAGSDDIRLAQPLASICAARSSEIRFSLGVRMCSAMMPSK